VDDEVTELFAVIRAADDVTGGLREAMRRVAEVRAGALRRLVEQMPATEVAARLGVTKQAVYRGAARQ
jgi:DNA invertase Pin-like site-specific DNA recombinase